MTPSTDARRRSIAASRTAGAGLAALTGLALVIAVGASLTGCGGTADRGEVRLGDVAGATPRAEPKARYGNMRSYVVFGKTYYPKKTSRNHTERGIASWYGPKFHGKKTSSGEIYDMHRMTAAHKTLPLPTYALVTNLENGRDLIVRINDRGPFVGDRIIDLSYAAAKHLGVDKQGTAMVQVTSVDPRDHDGEIPKTIALPSGSWGAIGRAPPFGYGDQRPRQPHRASRRRHRNTTGDSINRAGA
jgi:rare lipoprotein A